MGLKPSQSMKEFTPGPAAYNINRSLLNVSYTMRMKGPKVGGEELKNPGPGAYLTIDNREYIVGSKIGTGLRDDEFKR